MPLTEWNIEGNVCKAVFGNWKQRLIHDRPPLVVMVPRRLPISDPFLFSLYLLPSTDDLYSTIGCHPTRSSEFESYKKGGAEGYLSELSLLLDKHARSLSPKGKAVAVGECGLGEYWDLSGRYCHFHASRLTISKPHQLLSFRLRSTSLRSSRCSEATFRTSTRSLNQVQTSTIPSFKKLQFRFRFNSLPTSTRTSNSITESSSNPTDR